MRIFFTVFAMVFLHFETSLAQLAGFTLTGNPQSANGATWTYQDSVNGTWYDLQGILFKPATGTGPFPAVIINHGTGGNANGYSKSLAKKMVTWGFVCIATNLCHAGGVPIGSPGDTSLSNFGASTNNYLRDLKCWDILSNISYVDTACIMSFGHSRGAYTTTGLVASYPAKFSCAGHTAGGAITQTGYSAPSTTLATQINCPYIIHHGDSDNVVPLFYDSTLYAVFNSTGIAAQFYVYPGLNHPQVSLDSLMLARTQNWFISHSCPVSSATPAFPEFKKVWSCHPNPATSRLIIDFPGENFQVEIKDVSGRKIYQHKKITTQQVEVDCSGFDEGIYFISVQDTKNIFTKKIVVIR